MSETAPSGPLGGVRVLDLTSVIMGPYATQILGDLGADVITVEPARGETNRLMGAGPHRELSGVSLNILRNKRNLALDLKHPEGLAALLRLAATCDVFVTNLRPGPAGRLGLAYQDVAAVRPDIVYCRAHGWASGSGREDDPAYDDVIQSASGMVDLNERVTGTPTLVPMTLVDKVCGLTIAYAVSAALVHRLRTGQGQEIEVPMADVGTAFTLVEHGAGAIPVPPRERAGYPRILTPERRARPTKDGWLCVLPYSREHYEAVFRAGGREDLIGDDRIVNGQSRIEHSETLYQDVASILPQHTNAEWLDIFHRLGVPAAEVATVDELVERLPVVQHPVAGPYREIPSPVRFSATPAAVRRPAPRVGEHGVEVLREVGYADGEIDALVAEGVLRLPQPA